MQPLIRLPHSPSIGFVFPAVLGLGEMASQHFPLGVHIVKHPHTLLRVKPQIRNHAVGSERTMCFGVARHPSRYVVFRQIVPERSAGKFPLHLCDHLAVEQRRHIRIAKQPFQYLRIHGQQPAAAFCLRNIVLIHDGTDEPEQQVFRERRRDLRNRFAYGYRAGIQSVHDLAQRRQIVDVLQTFACGFQQQREIPLGSRRVEQLSRPQPLLP